MPLSEPKERSDPYQANPLPKELVEELMADDMLPEYEIDYSKARPNRFASPMAQTRTIELESDVAAGFTTQDAVNTVLRALIQTMPQPARDSITQEAGEHSQRRSQMVKRTLLFSTVLVVAVVLLGGLFTLIGNPVNGDTWSHQLQPSNQGSFYVNSSQSQLYPLSVKSHLGSDHKGNILTMGRIFYVWQSR